MPEITLPYPYREFACIEADPPWQYKDRGYNGHESVQRYRIHCPYPTMSVPEVKAMAYEVRRVTAVFAHLWLWTTKDFLFDAFGVMEEWGFSYRQTFTWLKTTKAGKPTYGMGHWGRNGTEFLLLGTTCGSYKLREYTSTPNYILAPRLGHSAKPEAAYDMIRKNSPGPRLSLFQRTPREDFTCWGNELREAVPTL